MWTYKQPPLDELIALRLAQYPKMKQRDFAAMLGITRLHHTAIEQGRRRPSIDLVLRWLKALAPEARLSMFGDVPNITRHIRALEEVQARAPKTRKAA